MDMSMVISVINLALVQFAVAVLAYTRLVVRENGRHLYHQNDTTLVL